MVLTETQATAIKGLIEKVENVAARCRNRLLTLEEARGRLEQLWGESVAIVQPDSEEWRLLDRERKEAQGWWRVERSGYVAASDATHFVRLRDALRQVLAISRVLAANEQPPAATAKLATPVVTTSRKRAFGARRRLKILSIVITASPWVYKAIDAWSNLEFLWLKRFRVVAFILSDAGLLAVMLVGLTLIWLSFRARGWGSHGAASR